MEYIMIKKAHTFDPAELKIKRTNVKPVSEHIGGCYPNEKLDVNRILSILFRLSLEKFHVNRV
ncbi:unnamed protein product [Prunus brigantina]